MREGGHHSGNWGGLLANPGIVMAHALATITDARGQIKVPEWRPKTLTNSVRAALADVSIDAGEGAPEIHEDWGEKGLTPVERVFGWNIFEVLAFKTGNPDRPVNAIPPSRRSPIASCASSSAPIRTTSCRRCAAISRSTASATSRSSRRAT